MVAFVAEVPVLVRHLISLSTGFLIVAALSQPSKHRAVKNHA